MAHMPDAWRRMASTVAGSTLERIKNLGMSPRQTELNRRWSHYTCQQYEARTRDWDGTTRPAQADRDMIASQGYVPPGYYEPNRSEDFPLKYRRPTIPYHLIRVIVDRFTGLLFSERHHPKIDCDDEDTEDFVNALVESSRLWAQMIKARNFGGACGTVAVGFQFRHGKPVVEVHDPRYLTPDFSDRLTLKLRAIEKRYMFPVERKEPGTDTWETVWYWYRRVIDEKSDQVWAQIPVGEGDEPPWDALPHYTVEHNFGFCPVVWLQNLPVEDDQDGEPDCLGIYDMAEGMDALLSSAYRGILSNSDPTPLFVTPDNIADTMRKGSGNGVHLKSGTFSYVEISGSGPLSARQMQQEIRALALEVAQCVLEHPDVQNATATEINRRMESMFSKVGIMREQYGQHGVLPLLRMMVDAARMLGVPRVDAGTGEVVRSAILLPPRIVDGVRKPRGLGREDAELAISWPGMVEPSLTDAQAASQAASTAKAAGLLDDENAAKFVSDYFHVDDVAAMLEGMKAQAGQVQSGLESDLLSMGGGSAPQLGAGSALPDDARVASQAPTNAGVPLGTTFYAYEIEDGIVTINEVRASKGMGPLPSGDGDLTVPQYRAKYKEVIAQATLAQSQAGAEEILGITPPAPPGGGGGGFGR